MKKLFFYFAAVALIGCRSTAPTTTQKPSDFRDVKMSMTLDSLTKMAATQGMINLREANDGVLDWKWLGDGFRHQDEHLFHEHCNSQEAFLKSLYPFDSLWASGKLRFHRSLVKGNLNCKSFGFESIDCNWEKVVKAAYADGVVPDFVHLFVLGEGFGTGNGGIGVLGIGNGVPSSADLCEYWGKLRKLNGHEDGHGLGLDHYPIPTYPANLMSQATNGGCFLGSTYLPEQIPIILNYINSKLK